jgi:hypothetical protein
MAFMRLCMNAYESGRVDPILGLAQATAWFSAGTSVLSFCLIAVGLRDEVPPHVKPRASVDGPYSKGSSVMKQVSDPHPVSSGDPGVDQDGVPCSFPLAQMLGGVASVLRHRGVRLLLVFESLNALAMDLLVSALASPAVAFLFNDSAMASGALMSYRSILASLAQAFLVAAATSHLSDATTVTVCTLLLAASLAMVSGVSTEAQLFIVVTPISLASKVLDVVVLARLTKLAPESRATVVSTRFVFVSMIGIVSPLLAARLLQHGTLSLIGLASSAVMTMSFALLVIFRPVASAL